MFGSEKLFLNLEIENIIPEPLPPVVSLSGTRARRADKLTTMKSRKPQPMTREEAEHRASAFGAWMRANVEREVRAGRLRETNDDGERATIH